MRLGLIGFPLEHSSSPKLYQELLGDELESYELFPFKAAEDVPSLDFFHKKLDGLNITSPYKTLFINKIQIDSPLVEKIGAVNTLVFSEKGTLGTNTDLLAVKEILQRFSIQYPELKILLLGSGVMASLTELVAEDLNIPLIKFSRKTHAHFSTTDLRPFQETNVQNLVINSCSRDFNFRGAFSGKEIFWDYNYAFLPHQNSIPSQVLSYQDGREMLELQAKAAIAFWKKHKPKLNY